MTTKKTFYAMICLSILMTAGIIVAFISSFGILKKSSDELVAVKLENRVLDEQQSFLVKAKKDIETYKELNGIAQSVVPQDKDQARTVRDITSIASSLGIKLSSVSFPASTLGQSSKISGAKTAVTQVTPVAGIPKLYEMQITVQQDTGAPISYEKFLDFLSKLEKNRRTAQVTSVTIQPTTSNRNNLTFNLVLSTYIKP
ncbi:MAG: hypothetical protein NTX11_04685 [Candidatus Saccharibacteria bacterium]|nr:hypothetical protein [Candidatus Saccharibacteria bacterium]